MTVIPAWKAWLPLIQVKSSRSSPLELLECVGSAPSPSQNQPLVICESLFMLISGMRFSGSAPGNFWLMVTPLGTVYCPINAAMYLE